MAVARGRFSLLRWGWRLVLLALFAGGWALAAAAVHVVIVPGDSEADDDAWKLLLLPKNRMGYSDTYADTRGWTAADAREHEDLVSRLIESGHGPRLAHVLENERLRRLEEMLKVRRATLVEDR